MLLALTSRTWQYADGSLLLWSLQRLGLSPVAPSWSLLMVQYTQRRRRSKRASPALFTEAIFGSMARTMRLLLFFSIRGTATIYYAIRNTGRCTITLWARMNIVWALVQFLYYVYIRWYLQQAHMPPFPPGNLGAERLSPE